MKDYLERLGLTAAVPLPDLMQAHLCSIPFENLDVLADHSISLAPEDVWRKLVGARRGGYCFEQNALFQTVLGLLGYEVTPLLARVRRGTTDVRPLTHMLLRVPWQGQDHLVDVGFGSDGLMRPMPFVAGALRQWKPGFTHQLVAEGDLFVLRLRRDGEDHWTDLYATDNRPAYAVDYEMGNHYTSTFPSSFFRHSMLVSLHQPEGFKLLFDGTFRTAEGSRPLADEAEVRQTLQAEFGLEPPDGMRVPPPPL